jgi:uncharacterized membrane protein
MQSYVFARIIHVICIVLWIGGVAMITMVVLPSLRDVSPERRLQVFESIESRFSLQAKLTVILAAISGFYMVYVTDTWNRYLQIRFWWLHAMTAIWLIFIILLFVLEPLFLHRWFRERAATDSEGTFRLIRRMHWLLLCLSFLTIAGAVSGAHGWFWF